jgi:hypothetical protein
MAECVHLTGAGVTALVGQESQASKPAAVAITLDLDD